MKRDWTAFPMLAACLWGLQHPGFAAAKLEAQGPLAEVVEVQPEVQAERAILASPVRVNPKEARVQRPLNGPGPFGSSVPEFMLKDPLGIEKQGAKLYGACGMLIMLTVPSLAQYEKQVRWQKLLKSAKWPERFAPTCVVLEDLSQQRMFKERARAAMKEKYVSEPGGVVVLIDEDGSVRRKFRVQENETVILLADSNGAIIHHESDEVAPGPEAARRVMQHVAKMADAHALAQTRVALPSATGEMLAAGARKP